MIQNNYGELVFNESDIIDLVMQDHATENLKSILVDGSVNIYQVKQFVANFADKLIAYNDTSSKTLSEWDQQQQQTWRMPKEYQELDIAQYILNLCESEEELQRAGAELLLYQEHELFNLLRYLKYLVDVMSENQVIWGVGRGSSIASFVLYKLKVHRINSLYYQLDIKEFLK